MSSNISRAQDYLMQIVSEGYGFDVPEIQKALKATNYESVEAAVQYLFSHTGGIASPKAAKTNNSHNHNHNSNNIKNNASTSKEMQELKEKISAMEIEAQLKLNVSADILTTAIRHNPNNTDEALHYIMETYPHLITPVAEPVTINSKKDAEVLKQELREKALREQQEQQHAAREREKELERQRQAALAAERKKEETRKRGKERAAQNRRALAEKKKAQKLKAQKSTLEWHKRHEEYDRKEIVRRQQLARNREKEAAHIDSPDRALQILFERYGEDEARETMQLLFKIVENIRKHPQEEKYRRLNLENTKIAELIVRPIGAVSFLRFLGFEQVVEKDAIFPDDELKQKKFLVYRDYDEAECASAVEKLKRYTAVTTTMVYAYYEQIAAEQKADDDDDDDDDQEIVAQKEKKQPSMSQDELYIAFMYVSRMVSNILISPTSAHLRMIEVDNELFKKRVGRFQVMQKLLKKLLGYRLEQGGAQARRVFVLHIPDKDEAAKRQQLLFLKNVCRDLSTIAQQRILVHTSIGNGVRKLCAHNADANQATELSKLFHTLLKALERILEEPLNNKFQAVNVEKLKQKYSSVRGVVSVLKLLGFKKDKIDTTKFVLGAHFANDLDSLTW
eukprot:CAMPEP_0202686926 /NCGR_PEP_ID=MMETSP1385-20130828/2675_1 /ASSEMBLY_ACC=CAM_ASM_000861 /TAXON_ID=933848 /ORGANISM="Elphidium margaritaceum" /LENGTH=620 /DNA_ID=CAMNT_0049341607 /DNA_START=84 /DNA_END=1943 /DNA_ORIENTATION=+